MNSIVEFEAFAHQLSAAGIEFPRNLKLVFELEPGDFKAIVPEHFHNLTEIEYNASGGIRFYLTQKQ